MTEIRATIGWDDLDAAFEAVEQELAHTARGISVLLWKGVLERTPQYAGRMAASWTYSLNTPTFVSRDQKAIEAIPDDDLSARQKGHPLAISVANSYSAGAEKAFKLGDTAWIANGVDHGEGPYSAWVEAAPLDWLRQVNHPGQPVNLTVATVMPQVQDMTPVAAARLRSLKIG